MRYIFDTAPLNSVDNNNNLQHTTLIGRMTKVAGVFCARLWEAVHALCHFFF